MVPLPPGSTLFPYTTLFRSGGRGNQDAGSDSRGVGVPIADGDVGRRERRRIDEPVERDHEDRKSTRLNSSHRCISYAVFCLKKKKKKHTRTRPYYILKEKHM